ncbi:hypothetical protein GCM10023333_33020 [Ferrimonas pelagia]|uniref:diguanylate cyclase n=2 Tax=Ferrimonas pelagia TaxID=1177826 RepID=A0ABP9F960_9GAMM
MLGSTLTLLGMQALLYLLFAHRHLAPQLLLTLLLFAALLLPVAGASALLAAALLLQRPPPARWQQSVLLLLCLFGWLCPTAVAYLCLTGLALYLQWQLVKTPASLSARVSLLCLLLLTLEPLFRLQLAPALSALLLLSWQLSQLLFPVRQQLESQRRTQQLYLSSKQRHLNQHQQRLTQLQSELTELSQQNRLLKEKNWVDALTGLRNRLYFDEQLTRETARSARDQSPLALLMIDLDHFKRVNDSYGHPIGDEVLQEVARRLYYSLRRPADALCRIGGEEFAVLLPSTNEQGALHVAEVIGTHIAAKPFQTSRGELHITVSIGCASLTHQTDGQLLHTQADNALYLAKQRGRNRIECASHAAALAVPTTTSAPH